MSAKQRKGQPGGKRGRRNAKAHKPPAFDVQGECDRPTDDELLAVLDFLAGVLRQRRKNNANEPGKGQCGPNVGQGESGG
jgi:hypothetical protein